MHPIRKRVMCEDLENAIAMAELEGLPEGFRPYHAKGTYNVWDNPVYVDEVLVKKIEQLLEQKYYGDLFKLITETNLDELLSPLTYTINGKEAKVSIGQIGHKFHDNTYAMLQRYIEVEHITGFENFKPYHTKKSSKEASSGEVSMVAEILVKKIEQLLEQRYDGDLFRLITETDQKELLSPLTDKLNGRDVEVSMSRVVKKFGDCLYTMLQHYIQLEHINGFKDFKPYHMKTAPLGTYSSEQNLIDKVLVKKIQQLLDQKYEGNLFRLITEIEVKELLSPLKDKLNGKEVEVSMMRVGTKFQSSAYTMLQHYIELENILGFEDFKPYHMKQSSKGTYTGEHNLINEVLVKKIQQLLDQKYDGDLFRLITEIEAKELLSPLKDKLNGKEVKVSMGAVGQKFQNSPYAMLQHYFKLKGKKFPYTKACFVGSPETRKRRIEGRFNARDLSQIVDGDTYDTAKFGFREFRGDDKATVRELIAEYYIERLGEEEVKYLGLESERFESLRVFSELLNWDSESATVIERDKRVFNTMRSIQKNATNGLKRALSGAKIVNGEFDHEVESLDRKYNLVNLDTCGHMSSEKEQSIELLFNNDCFTDSAILYVTLDNSGIGKHRAETQGYPEQIKALDEIVSVSAAANQYDIKYKFILPYDGGTGHAKRPMVIAGFYIERKITDNDEISFQERILEQAKSSVKEPEYKGPVIRSIVAD